METLSTPCVEREKHDFSDTAQNILRTEHVPAADRLYVVLRLDIPRRVLLEFAWWCATQVRHLMHDNRSTRALDVLRAYLDGTTTIDDLRAAAAYAADAADARKTQVKRLIALLDNAESEG